MVTDTYGNPVVNGTVIYFTFEDGADLNAPPPSAGQEVCPTASTGTSAEAGSCVGATTAQEGVARTLLTWPSELIWTSYTLYAETQSDSAVKDDYTGLYPAFEGVTIVVSVTPPSVTAGTQNIDVTARYQDGAGNNIYDRFLDFTTNSGLVTVNPPTSVATNLDGYASTTVDTANCSNDATVTITASDAPFSSTGGELTIQGTEPTADFINTNIGTSFSFTNISIEPPGYSYTYEWNFGDGTPVSILANPTHDYGAGESGNTFTVTLRVTNDAPGACFDIITGSVKVP